MGSTTTIHAFPPFPRVPLSYGQLLGPAMSVQTTDEAAAYMREAVAWMVDVYGKSEKEAAEIMRSNLGYYPGYGTHEDRARVERLFSTAHPVFGAIADNGPTSPEEAYAAGLEVGCGR